MCIYAYNNVHLIVFSCYFFKFIFVAVVNQRIIGFYSSAVHVAINFFDSFLGLQLFSSGDRFSSVAVPVFIYVCVFTVLMQMYIECVY